MTGIRLLVRVLLDAAGGCQQQVPAAALPTPSAAELLVAVDGGNVKAVRALIAKGIDPEAGVRRTATAIH